MTEIPPVPDLAQARTLEMAVVEAFGLDPDNVIDGHMRIEGQGLRVDLTEAPPVEFPAKDWTPEQEQAVMGLYEDFPLRWLGSIPSRWERETTS